MVVNSTRKVNKEVMGGLEKVRVAAIQAPQIVFNKEKSVEIACERIKEAGSNGAKLVAFSETYIPTFPAYYTGGFNSDMEEWALWNVSLQDHSIAIPGEETDAIGKACREANVFCVMGVNEIDETDGARTLYNTQIFFGNDGTILGKRRKLMPTYTERTYWGMGDGSDLQVHETEIGRIGALICWEHHTILVRAAQMLMGEEFHIANWPGTWRIGNKDKKGNRTGRLLEPSPDINGSDWQFAAKEYAFESGSFVISVNGLLRKEDFEPEYKSFIDSPNVNFDWAIGGSAIINPFGEYITEPVFHEDTIVYGDCEAKDIKAAKIVFDGLGHYSRPDVGRLLVDKGAKNNLLFESENKVTHSDLRRVSEATEVPVEKLEKIIEKFEHLQSSKSDI